MFVPPKKSIVTEIDYVCTPKKSIVTEIDYVCARHGSRVWGARGVWVCVSALRSFHCHDQPSGALSQVGGLGLQTMVMCMYKAR